MWKDAKNPEMHQEFIEQLNAMGLDPDQARALAGMASVEPECTVEDCMTCKVFLECVMEGVDDEFG